MRERTPTLSTEAAALGSSRNSKSRVRYLDGMRGLAILGVVCVHWRGHFITHGFFGGYIGVDIFFVLSGYIISRIIFERQGMSYLAFLKKRVRRLYPPLVGMLIGGILIALVVSGFSTLLTATIGNALLSVFQVGSIWRAANFGALSPFGVTWSLAIEWYFYLVWPMVAFRLARRDLVNGKTAMLLLVSAAVFYGISLLLNPDWFHYGPLAHIAELLVGAGVAVVAVGVPFQRHFAQAPVYGAIAVLGVLMIVWSLVGPTSDSNWYGFVALPLTVGCTAIAILACVAWPQGAVASALSWRPLSNLGLVSYSLYLWHTVPLALINTYNTTIPKAALVVIDIGLAIVMTTISYVFLEKQLRPRHVLSLPRRARSEVPS